MKKAVECLGAFDEEEGTKTAWTTKANAATANSRRQWDEFLSAPADGVTRNGQMTFITV
jgi:hypothetical protein